MNHELAASVAAIANWRRRKEWDNRVVSDDDVRAQCRQKWPGIADSEVEEIVAAVNQRFSHAVPR